MWEKIVVNLLANAVKYTFVGGIDVALRADGDRFVLTVADTGVGIVADELPQLFQRFHRVAGAAARTREGTGIGLALVHELAALHEGTVSVDSEPGVGSTFTVTMPFGTPDSSDEAGARTVGPSEAARGEAASWAQDTARPGDQATGAVGRRHPGGRRQRRHAGLPDPAARPALAGPHDREREGGAGCDLRRRPDVVLTDVMIPRVDGFELLRALRSDPATAGIPVIMLTARAGQEASVEGLDAGADDYLAKPFQAAELIARVRVALERTAGRRSTPPAPRPVTDAAAVLETGPPSDVVPERAGPPSPRRPDARPGAGAAPPPRSGGCRRPPPSIPVLRRRLRALLDGAGVDPDRTYDLLLAATEAATNAVEHAQDPTEPFIDVSATVTGGDVRIDVRDHGQWRERGPSMDRGRGSTLMGAIGEVTATPSPEGTTVVITSSLVDEPGSTAAG